MVLVPNQSKGKGTRTSFPTKGREKVLNEIEFCILCYVQNFVIFAQAPTKCFNVPVNRTLLFDKNNLFING